MSSAALTNSVSKPFWIARYPIATAMCVFPRSGLAVKDQAAPVGDEVRRQCRTEQRELHGALVGEVEIVDGLEERESSSTREALDAGLLAMGNLLGDEDGEEVATAPRFDLGTLDEVAPCAPRIGEVETLEHGVEVDVGRLHTRSSCCKAAPVPAPLVLMR